MLSVWSPLAARPHVRVVGPVHQHVLGGVGAVARAGGPEARARAVADRAAEEADPVRAADERAVRADVAPGDVAGLVVHVRGAGAEFAELHPRPADDPDAGERRRLALGRPEADRRLAGARVGVDDLVAVCAGGDSHRVAALRGGIRRGDVRAGIAVVDLLRVVRARAAAAVRVDPQVRGVRRLHDHGGGRRSRRPAAVLRRDAAGHPRILVVGARRVGRAGRAADRPRAAAPLERVGVRRPRPVARRALQDLAGDRAPGDRRGPRVRRRGVRRQRQRDHDAEQHDPAEDAADEERTETSLLDRLAGQARAAAYRAGAGAGATPQMWGAAATADPQPRSWRGATAPAAWIAWTRATKGDP